MTMQPPYRLVLVAAISLSLGLVASCGKPSPTPAAASTGPAASPASGEQRVGDLVISAASTRETVLAGVTGVGFLSIRNTGATEDVLLGATSPAAGSVEIHEMSMSGGVMRMRALAEGLPIPAGATVKLASGGIHLMLIDTKAPFATGDTVEVELHFARAGTTKIALRTEPQGVAE